MQVTVWCEGGVANRRPEILAAYPKGIEGALSGLFAAQEDMTSCGVTMEMPEQGLSPELLEKTDVLLWWGHCYHDKVEDALVERVVERVQRGMGIVFLHSSHMSKPFRRLMGTSCTLKWREIGERERLWVVDPAHPIAEGLPEYVEIPHEEMYGERFDIPAPDELVFLGWYPGGEVFRSGCAYRRGLGRVFYFQPGHETYPVYFQPEIQRILLNAVRWAKPGRIADSLGCPCVEPLEKI